MEDSKKEIQMDKNLIFIGDKPLGAYVKSAVLLSKKNSLDITIKSRGRYISKAVDICEIVRRQFFDKEGIKLKDIKISTESFERDGKKSSVSVMDITLGR